MLQSNMQRAADVRRVNSAIADRVGSTAEVPPKTDEIAAPPRTVSSANTGLKQRSTMAIRYLVGPHEVPTAKWSDLRYGLSGQLEDHDGEAAQA